MAVGAERYLTVRDVAQRFAVSIQTVWRWAKDRPEFPNPVELSPGTTRWRISDLIAFESGLSGDI
ncbi:AlpA family phage regulatory protein [Sinorhizobium meliloti]|nr:AlpA family phage regulatory protein [Sinorhizobium meliloti]